MTIRQEHRIFPCPFDRTGSIARATPDVLQGTLDLLVLKALSLGPMHGWGISQRILQGSRDALQVGQGSLYPALYRLERKVLIAGEWRVSENNREAKYYQLTTAGERALELEITRWRRYCRAVDLFITCEA